MIALVPGRGTLDLAGLLVALPSAGARGGFDMFRFNRGSVARVRKESGSQGSDASGELSSQPRL